MKHSKLIKKAFLAFLVGILFTSCIANVEETLIEDPVGEQITSFKDKVKPIIDSRCTVCHSPSGGTSPDLTNYANINGKSSRVKARVGNGTMPPTGALPQAQIDIIVKWVDEGALDN
ncbi:MAG: c-type cytochrome [Polaribacter sp.]